MTKTSKTIRTTDLPEAGLLLSAEPFQHLAEVSEVVTWLADIENPHTQRAYQNDLEGFVTFSEIRQVDELRKVARADVVTWCDHLGAQGLAPATIRRKLSAMSSFYDVLCNTDAIGHNPFAAVVRPEVDTSDSKTPILTDAQAKKLLLAPQGNSLKAIRDRAIIATCLYHALRRTELTHLKVNSLQEHRGSLGFKVEGKGSKARFVPAHPDALEKIFVYLDAAGHREDRCGGLFRPIKYNRTGTLNRAISGDGIYRMVKLYAAAAGIQVDRICLHALRATAASNALENGANFFSVQEWLGAPILKTHRFYDRAGPRSKESPTFRVKYR